MTTLHDARHGVLLDAVCALAAAMPLESRTLAAAALTQRAARMAPFDEATDTTIASDLARILEALGCLPSVAAISAGGSPTEIG